MKICKNCKYAEFKILYLATVCKHKDISFPRVNPVSGENVTKYKDCWIERSDIFGRCGANGNLFESKK